MSETIKTLSDNNPWESTEVSLKAWMSVRDADLLENLIFRMAEQKAGIPLEIIEWGAGRSTLWFTRMLTYFEIPFRWTSLESDRGFFKQKIVPHIESDPLIHYSYFKDSTENSHSANKTQIGLSFIVFNHGCVMPFETGLIQDRLVNMDEYVALPERAQLQCDIAIVDGRKRRRCVIAARDRLNPGGVVLLHDAWRKHYAGAYDAYHQYERVGDEWAIGAMDEVDFEMLLPSHAFQGE